MTYLGRNWLNYATDYPSNISSEICSVERKADSIWLIVCPQMESCIEIDSFHRCAPPPPPPPPPPPLVACRQPARSYDRLCEVVYVFEFMLLIPALWYFDMSVICLYRSCRVKFVMIPPCYVYNNICEILLYNYQLNVLTNVLILLFRLLTAIGKKMWNGTIWYAWAPQLRYIIPHKICTSFYYAWDRCD